MNKMIIVCDRCLKASCFQGIFYCDDYQDAGTTEIPIEELRKMKLESEDYWNENNEN